jgi:hypothetical protein
MPREHPSRLGLLRTLALAVVTLLGLLAIVGSGGGGFPPCSLPGCGEPPPPLPSATITPAYLTAQVGTPVTWTVTVANLSGTPSYQWLRRDAGAPSYVEIAGATAASYSLPSVNLADDGAAFLVAVASSSGGFGTQAVAHLVVSAAPGIVFEDGEFLPQDWIVTPLTPGAPVPPPSVVTERLDSGGNPGAWRRMVFGIGSDSGVASALYLSSAASYDPAQQGAIKVLEHAEDCGTAPPSDMVSTESALAIEQAGRRYVAYPNANCGAAPWRVGVGRASLTAQDFALLDGPACASGEACPDFSVSGAPMRFGYRRAVFAVPGASVAHAIDNWRVTVWR